MKIYKLNPRFKINSLLRLRKYLQDKLPEDTVAIEITPQQMYEYVGLCVPQQINQLVKLAVEDTERFLIPTV